MEGHQSLLFFLLYINNEVYMSEHDEQYDMNGVSLDLISHDQMFKALRITPIIVNDIAREFSLGKSVEVINSQIRTHYGNDELDTLPSCEKGCTTGRFNLGVECPKCHHPVQRIVDQKMEPQLWMQIPDGFDGFINPRFWGLFRSYFCSTKFDLIEYLTSQSYIPGGRNNPTSDDDAVREIIDVLERNGIQRGLNFFIRNFKKIMDVVLIPKPFMNHKSFNMAEKYRICAEWKEFIDEYEECIFSQYLPFPSKLVMVSESSNSLGYIDPNMPIAFDAVKTIVSCVKTVGELSERSIETRIIKTQRLLSEYYHKFRDKTCGKKQGMWRRQLGSTRSPYSARGVIAPIVGPHEYDELHAPWGFTITLMGVHISNKLLKRDFTPYELRRFKDKCVVNCEGIDGDEMEEILYELIDESPCKGIPTAMLRNPTLERLSDQPFRITKVTRSLTNNAIMMSVLVIKGPNADFDGDQLQLKLLLDRKEQMQWSRLATHLALMDPSKPRTINGVVTLHPELITMVNNFLDKYRLVKKA